MASNTTPALQPLADCLGQIAPIRAGNLLEQGDGNGIAASGQDGLLAAARRRGRGRCGMYLPGLRLIVSIAFTMSAAVTVGVGFIAVLSWWWGVIDKLDQDILDLNLAVAINRGLEAHCLRSLRRRPAAAGHLEADVGEQAVRESLDDRCARGVFGQPEYGGYPFVVVVVAEISVWGLAISLSSA